jgi:hypothetical protein
LRSVYYHRVEGDGWSCEWTFCEGIFGSVNIPTSYMNSGIENWKTLSNKVAVAREEDGLLKNHVTCPAIEQGS